MVVSGLVHQEISTTPAHHPSFSRLVFSLLFSCWCLVSGYNRPPIRFGGSGWVRAGVWLGGSVMWNRRSGPSRLLGGWITHGGVRVGQPGVIPVPCSLSGLGCESSGVSTHGCPGRSSRGLQMINAIQINSKSIKMS